MEGQTTIETYYNQLNTTKKPVLKTNMAWAIVAYATWSSCICSSVNELSIIGNGYASHVVEEVIKVMAKGPHHSRTPPPGSTYYEITKQDDALSYLSNILGELKEMAVDMVYDALSYMTNILGELKEMAMDMGSEIERHNKAFNPLDNDVEELTIRVKGVNQCTRCLLGK
ncbi:SNAP25 homologous protein SNAP33-like protein [Tanacetum coccineum]